MLPSGEVVNSVPYDDAGCVQPVSSTSTYTCVVRNKRPSGLLRYPVVPLGSKRTGNTWVDVTWGTFAPAPAPASTSFASFMVSLGVTFVPMPLGPKDPPEKPCGVKLWGVRLSVRLHVRVMLILTSQ